MHEGEFLIDADLVRRLVAGQFPELAEEPVERVRSTGTVNAIFRIGADLCARLPLLPGGDRDLDREWTWLPILRPSVSVRLPEPVAAGRATAAYPSRWSLYRWIDGAPYADGLVTDEARAAEDLAAFVLELRRVETTGAPPAGRRPLRELDMATRATIAASAGVIDHHAADEVWRRVVTAPAWAGDPVWIHSDLLRPNVLVHGGRVEAVIDFGGAGVGDPAADVIAAWAVFGPVGRAVFRRALEVDDDTWERARGFALHQAAAIIPYYPETNPAFVTLARRTVEQILLDPPR